ncbi:hypothetical protein B0T24DRAFT_109310 [Lasiosphaeria ovina]|uniref:Uncharacterized protein n=1 Tax=Lasiosphaeria ovina TaxID=92902 RepID=A0AAE0JU14_9PEZI|nr:hypothetical protein B0T24DRAFT_109310 [Lasiosphaeria ovina]
MPRHVVLLSLALLLRPAAATPRIGCTRPVNTSEADEAARQLGAFCADNGPISAAAKVSWRVGGTRAYACNYAGSGANPCSFGELMAVQKAIDARCRGGEAAADGIIGGGWWYEPAWKKTYGFDGAAASWCGNL